MHVKACWVNHFQDGLSLMQQLKEAQGLYGHHCTSERECLGTADTAPTIEVKRFTGAAVMKATSLAR